MKILVIIFIVLVVADIVATSIFYRKLKKRLNQPVPFQVNNVQVEEFFWSQVLLKEEIESLKDDKEKYLKYLTERGSKEIAVKILKSGLIETHLDKYDDGTEKISLRLRVVRSK